MPRACGAVRDACHYTRSLHSKADFCVAVQSRGNSTMPSTWSAASEPDRVARGRGRHLCTRQRACSARLCPLAPPRTYPLPCVMYTRPCYHTRYHPPTHTRTRRRCVGGVRSRSRAHCATVDARAPWLKNTSSACSSRQPLRLSTSKAIGSLRASGEIRDSYIQTMKMWHRYGPI